MDIATATTHSPRYRAWDVVFFKAAMVLIFFLFGYAKWFDYEAQALIKLTSNSPLFAWMHHAYGPHMVSYLLGVAEWTTGLLLLLGMRWQLPALLGAAGSCLTFAVTTTMIFTTPGAWEASAGGLPAMGGATSFLVKDVALLAVSVFLLREAWHGKQALSSKRRVLAVSATSGRAGDGASRLRQIRPLKR
jgi:uncharacterized membrane protein YkgB